VALNFGGPKRGIMRHRLPSWGTALIVIVVLGAGALVAYLVTSSGPTARPPATAPPSPPPRGPTAGIGVVRQDLDVWRAASDYQAYSYVIVGRELAARAARAPGRSLVYFSGTDVNTRWDAGVPYRLAVAKGWLLRGAGGDLLVNQGYPDNFVADVGDRAYQRAWLANVLRFLRRHGDDGVFIDDVVRDLLPLAGAEAAKYPSQQAWAAAQLSFLAAVGPALRAHGYYVLVNASGYIPGDQTSDDGSSTAAWWRQLAPYVSGLLNEYYQQISDGSDALRSSGGAWDENWDGWQRLVDTAQSLGKDFVGLAYGPSSDTQRMSYAKASFLLDWNGRGGALIYEPEDHDTNPWNPAWTADIGRPAAPKRRVGSGWLRRYSDGLSLVNPDPAASQTFNLRGSYLTPDGHTVTTITLPPTSGLILTSRALARASAGVNGRASSATNGQR
jgi:hypothetical protein